MASPTTTRTSRRTARRTRSTATVLALLAGTIGLGMFSGVGAAGAAAPVSQARGQFLSGTIGGRDLSAVASIAGVEAQNFGGSPVVRSNTLQASALNAINLPLTGVLQLPGGNAVRLGAVGQYSRADGDGAASAASGAVGNSGGIGVGSAPGGLPADATIVLPGPSGTALGSIRIALGAVSAAASQGAGGGQTGAYRIASLSLELDSPALAAAARPPVAAISGGAGALQQKFGAAVPGVTVAGLDQLPTAGGLTALSVAGGAVTADLTTGTVHIDIAALLTSLGLDLNQLPANTHLLPYLTRALGTLAPAAAQSALTTLQTRFDSALGGLTFSKAGTPVSGTQLQALDAIRQQAASALSTTATQAAANIGGNAFEPLANALASALDIIVNGRSRSGGTFTQQAVEINLGSGTSGAQLVLASASVGPSTQPARITAAPPATTAAAPAAPQGRSAIKIDAGRAATTRMSPAAETLAGASLLVLAAATWRLFVLRRRA